MFFKNIDKTKCHTVIKYFLSLRFNSNRNNKPSWIPHWETCWQHFQYEEMLNSDMVIHPFVMIDVPKESTSYVNWSLAKKKVLFYEDSVPIHISWWIGYELLPRAQCSPDLAQLRGWTFRVPQFEEVVHWKNTHFRYGAETKRHTYFI